MVAAKIFIQQMAGMEMLLYQSMNYHFVAMEKMCVMISRAHLPFQPLVLPVIIQIRLHLHAVYQHQVLPHHHRRARPWHRQKW